MSFSIAASAARPASSSSKPWRPASVVTARRACAIWLDSVTIRLCTSSLPARDRDARALAGRRLDVELVRELACAVQAEAETVAAGVAIAQRELDVGDTGAFVFECQSQPIALRALVQALDALETNHDYTQLPALFTTDPGDAKELVYLNDALAISLDQLIQDASPPADRAGERVTQPPPTTVPAADSWRAPNA